VAWPAFVVRSRFWCIPRVFTCGVVGTSLEAVKTQMCTEWARTEFASMNSGACTTHLFFWAGNPEVDVVASHVLWPSSAAGAGDTTPAVGATQRTQRYTECTHAELVLHRRLYPSLRTQFNIFISGLENSRSRLTEVVSCSVAKFGIQGWRHDTSSSCHPDMYRAHS